MKTLSLNLRQGRPTASAFSPRLAAQPLSPSPSLSTFDPTLPQDGALVVAEVLRDQFNGLADMITEVPTITSAQVDAVNTLPAGDLAYVGVTITDGVLHLTFGIPEGQSGPPGEVTQAELDTSIADALALTSSNSNAVALMGESADNLYNQMQMQGLINKVDELINTLRR